MRTRIPYQKHVLRRLTEDELKLWNKISQDIKPLNVIDRCVENTFQKKENANVISAPESAKANPLTRSTCEKLSKKTNNNNLGSFASSSVRMQLVEFDGRLAVKVGKGRIKIDARLDHHGMRQVEAKTALKKFLFSSLAKGYRIVLVITGKGSPVDTSMPWYGEPQVNRGVLKRMLPQWLRESQITSAVVSYTTAHIQHGGDGAFYIRIRAQNRY